MHSDISYSPLPLSHGDGQLYHSKRVEEGRFFTSYEEYYRRNYYLLRVGHGQYTHAQIYKKEFHLFVSLTQPP